MNRSRLFSAALSATIMFGGSAALMMPASPVWAADEKPSVRQEVGKPLQAAQEALKAKDFKTALSHLQEADAVANKTAYETYAINAIRFQAAYGAGDLPLAIKSGQAALASGQVTPDKVAPMEENIAGLAYKAKDYATVIDYSNRYYKDGGTNQTLRVMVAQSYYLQNDFPNAAKWMRQVVQAEKAAGTPPSEEHLTLLMSVEYKQNPTGAGYADALFQLVQYYPKKEYWNDALLIVQKKPGFQDRYRLDVDHLKIATGVMDTAAGYTDAAQSALEAGLPGDAKAMLDKGYAVNLLGQGPDAARNKRLADLAAKQAADDVKTLGTNDKIAEGKPNGDDLFTLGDAYASYGQYDNAIAAYLKGIPKGSGKYPLAEAKLHLGVTYLLANQKAKAKETLKSVNSTDGAQDLATLWMIQGGLT